MIKDVNADKNLLFIFSQTTSLQIKLPLNKYLLVITLFQI